MQHCTSCQATDQLVPCSLEQDILSDKNIPILFPVEHVQFQDSCDWYVVSYRIQTLRFNDQGSNCSYAPTKVSVSMLRPGMREPIYVNMDVLLVLNAGHVSINYLMLTVKFYVEPHVFVLNGIEGEFTLYKNRLLPWRMSKQHTDTMLRKLKWAKRASVHQRQAFRSGFVRGFQGLEEVEFESEWFDAGYETGQKELGIIRREFMNPRLPAHVWNSVWEEESSLAMSDGDRLVHWEQ